ncbi:MAG: TlpA family protein disulfide reductase [Planctomycetota bacterium]
MVDRLKNEPFALLGLNSDGDRDVSSKLEDAEKAAIRAAGMRENQAIDAIRRGDAKVMEKLGALGAPLKKKVFDADLANLDKILTKNKITWRQHVMGTTDAALPNQWNVQGWPTIYILDEKGVIRFRDLRDEEMEEAVVKLLEEMKEKKRR